MIEKPGSMAVQTLVLNYVMTRGYHDSSAAEHQQSSWSDEEDERYKHREGRSEYLLKILGLFFISILKLYFHLSFRLTDKGWLVLSCLYWLQNDIFNFLSRN